MQSHKPTILIANGTMNAGGTETLIMEILRHQTGRVRYILMIHYQGEIRKGIFDDEIRSLGVDIIYIPSVGSVGINGYCNIFREIVAPLGKIDVIHSHLNANGGIICKAAKMVGIRNRISHCHADIRFKGSKLNKLKEEFALQILRLYVNHYSNHFWACSHEAWKRLFYPWGKEVVIPNMIDVKKYLSSLEDKEKAKASIGLEGKFVIGSVGRVARIKNYELAIEVTAKLNQSGKETYFVCYGRFDVNNDAYCAELLAFSERLGVSDKIRFMGNTADVPKAIKAFDIFLMPSTTEGFGIAAIEAQAAGIPTLLSTGVPRIVDVGLDLVEFQPLEPELWVEAVAKKACGLNILEPERIIKAFNEKEYNSATMVKSIEDKYLEMINQ